MQSLVVSSSLLFRGAVDKPKSASLMWPARDRSKLAGFTANTGRSQRLAPSSGWNLLRQLLGGIDVPLRLVCTKARNAALCNPRQLTIPMDDASGMKVRKPHESLGKVEPRPAFLNKTHPERFVREYAVSVLWKAVAS